MRELSLHILDILQNSIAAGASKIEIDVIANKLENLLLLSIKDNGKGMEKDFLDRVKDPFITTRTTRKVGLGIPMLTAAAEMCDGSLQIESEKGKGTTLTANFSLRHIDRMPIGDLTGTLIIAIVSNPDINFVFKYRVDDNIFILDTNEIVENLDGVPINDPAIIRWIKDYLTENMNAIGMIQ